MVRTDRVTVVSPCARCTAGLPLMLGMPWAFGTSLGYHLVGGWEMLCFVLI